MATLTRESEEVIGSDDEFRICEYCKCRTNARMRACCNAGRAVDGLKAALAKTRWIPVEERLPKLGQASGFSEDVWVAGNKKVSIGYYRESPQYNGWHCRIEHNSLIPITHWREIILPD